MASVNTFIGFLARKLEAGGSETTIYLDRITTRTGETITTPQFSTLGRGILTINPDGDGETSYPEWASFTAVDSSTVAVTGAIRGLSALGNSVVTANKRFHPVGTPVVISFGVHNFQDILDKIDDDITAATVGTANVVTGIAGETIATAPALVHLKNDGKWWLTDADTEATINEVQLGIALSAVSAEASITNGIVRKGRVPGFTGLVAGTTYYASNTAGEISSSAGTNAKRIGEAKSTTELYFDPEYYELPTTDEKAAMAGGTYFGQPDTDNKFITEGFVGAGDGSDGDVVISVDTTLTEDKFYNNLTINSGIKLYPDGYRIFVKGTLTGPGTISFNGNDGADATDATASAAGVGGAAGAVSGSGPLKTVAGTAGETGANTTTVQSGAGTAVNNTTPGVSGSRGGAGGSTGGDATQVSAAQASTAGTSSISENWKMLRTSVINLINLPTSVDLITQAASTSTGGGGGVGNNFGNTSRGRGGGGGGGGASGGFIFVVANSVVGPITFEAIGGDGGNGSNGNSDPDNFYGGGGGGGGGAGGTVILVYGRKTGTNTYTLTGGTAGTGGTGSSPGNGAAGTNGLTGAYYELKYSDLM